MVKYLTLFLALVILAISTTGVSAQSVSGSISGTVADERGAVISGASVTARNVQTGFARTANADGEGRFKFANVPVGNYEITVEAANFAKLVQSGITLVLNQDAVVDLTLKPGSVSEVVNVTENASVLNTTTAEVSTRFDSKRLSELPIAPNRNVFNVLLSTPGVSQLSSGQTGFANGLSFSSNGGRLRSNNFMLDGQDINDPSVSGGQVALNNPDAIGEVRIITNQFLAEYGRNSGSVVNFIGKSGTNDFHGTGFVFYNGEELNACSNTDRIAGFCNPASAIDNRRIAPFRKEFQYGFTVGGPFLKFGEGVPALARDKTFFFWDYQKWTDRQLASGSAINGAPTAAGRAILQSIAAGRPQVQALLTYLPAGAANGTSTTFTLNGVTQTVPLGTFSGTSALTFDSTQTSYRMDHRFSDRNLLYGRYRYDRNVTAGGGQVSPAGLTTVVPTRSQAATLVLNSVLTSRLSNEARVSWSRFGSTTSAADPSSLVIPSIEISPLGLTGFNAAATRTGIGLAVNLPQFRFNDTYQIQDSMVYVTGDHSFKFGVDLRRTDARVFFLPLTRGRLSYTGTTLDNFVNDTAAEAGFNSPLRGGDIINFYRWKEYYVYGQDEWRIKNNFTLTFGLRYEYPGDSFSYLKENNTRVLAANGNNPGFTYDPQPQADKNNFMPRIGFNWNPRFGTDGLVGFLTGGDKLVLRGGYSRTYDANYINLNLNVASSFPFVVATALAGAQLTGAFVTLQAAVANPNPVVAAPLLQTRTVVGADFRAPSTDQFSFEVQRELTTNTIFKAGYIHTRGRGLFQTVDGNPRTMCPTQLLAVPVACPRVDPTRGVIRLRANMAESDYNALQLSLDKRLSRNFSANLNYTFSKFIDTASETFNPSNAEVAVSQDSFNLAADRSLSSFDRPHRISGSVVYELPFFREQQGFVGRVLGGFQVNSFFTLQSGAPFTVLNGSDPAFALQGISGLVGDAIRPNLVGSPNFSGMTPREIRAACGTAIINQPTNPQNGNRCPNFFSLVVPGQRVGNSGRNILRAAKLFLVDFGIIKNTRISEKVRFQVRADMFNVLNRRNYGVPINARLNSPDFLLDGAVAAGNRRIILGARLVF